MQLSGARWTNIQTVDQWYCAVHTHTHTHKHRYRLRTWMTAEWSTRTLRSCILVPAIWLARGPRPEPPVSSFPAAGKARHAETTVSGTSHYSQMSSAGLGIRHNTNTLKMRKISSTWKTVNKYGKWRTLRRSTQTLFWDVVPSQYFVT